MMDITRLLHKHFYKSIFVLLAKLDGVKTYMRIRKVPSNIQNKVIKWFDYLWLTQEIHGYTVLYSVYINKKESVNSYVIHIHVSDASTGIFSLKVQQLLILLMGLSNCSREKVYYCIHKRGN
jgi:hypothetical protein